MTHLWHCGSYDIDVSVPHIMGIVNVTPDSFSDGGSYTTTELAVAHARELIDQGATIIDIGGESTRSGSVAPSIEEEIRRVVPVVEALRDLGVPLSVDTRHAQVAQASVEAGAAIINDVAGFRDPEMVRVAASCDAGLVAMHMQGTPEMMQNDPRYEDVSLEVTTYLATRAKELEAAGIARERICLDPGYGFGKTTAHNLELTVGLPQLLELGYPVLVGISRKRYIGALFGIDVARERDVASAQLVAAMVARGAQIARVHNVEETRIALADVRDANAPAHRAFVALGSNLGDRVENLTRALELLGASPLTEVVATSSIVESEPAFKQDQPTFYNAVVEVETRLAPLAFFAELQAIEAVMGRVKLEVNGPRIIDLDLLTFDDESIALPGLSVPHPGIAERDFVVTPLLEIAPDIAINGEPLTRERVKYGEVIATLKGLTDSRPSF